MTRADDWALRLAPPPPLDAESGAALAAMRPRRGWAGVERFVTTLRETTDFDASDEELSLGGRVEVLHHEVPTADGTTRELLVCRPKQVDDLAPAIYFVHGGGMVSGTPRRGLLEVLHAALEFDAAVFAIDYRLPPEHQDPLPVEDTYAGLVATIELAPRLGVDRERVVMLGSSAGGALAAGSALFARDRDGPHLAGVMLLNPMLDDRNESYSTFQMAEVDQWDRRANEAGWEALLGARRGGGDVAPSSAPGRATDLAGLPPIFLDVGSAETLRDEVVDFASRIWRAGGQAELHVWPGGFHGYEFVAPHSRLAQATWRARVGWLRRMLAE